VGDRKELEANADKQELLINGDFNLGLYGWTGYASLIKEENGNKFIRNGYNWEVFQPLEVVPEQNYVITAKTRTVNSSAPSRIKIIFYNDEGQRAPEFYNILHVPGTGTWENITEVLQIPPGYHLARIYLLSDDSAGNGTSDFDNVSFKQVSDEELKNIVVSTGEKTRIIRGSQDNHIKYVVQSGDTASSIARHFGVPVENLIDENSLRNPDRLEVGQILYIPQK
jgi:LysM repeat protein